MSAKNNFFEVMITSRVLYKVFEYFVTCDEPIYLRALGKGIDEDVASVNRTLKRLVKAELITRTTKDNRIYYQANPDCPFLDDVRSIFSKSLSTEIKL